MFRSDHLGFGINHEENRGSVGVHSLKVSQNMLTSGKREKC